MLSAEKEAQRGAQRRAQRGAEKQCSSAGGKRPKRGVSSVSLDLIFGPSRFGAEKTDRLGPITQTVFPLLLHLILLLELLLAGRLSLAEGRSLAANQRAKSEYLSSSALCALGRRARATSGFFPQGISARCSCCRSCCAPCQACCLLLGHFRRAISKPERRKWLARSSRAACRKLLAGGSRTRSSSAPVSRNWTLRPEEA